MIRFRQFWGSDRHFCTQTIRRFQLRNCLRPKWSNWNSKKREKKQINIAVDATFISHCSLAESKCVMQSTNSYLWTTTAKCSSRQTHLFHWSRQRKREERREERGERSTVNRANIFRIAYICRLTLCQCQSYSMIRVKFEISISCWMMNYEFSRQCLPSRWSGDYVPLVAWAEWTAHCAVNLLCFRSIFEFSFRQWR